MDLLTNKINLYPAGKIVRCIIVLYSLLMLSSCTVEKRIQRQLKREFKHSEILQKHYTGFALYDPGSKRMIYENHADRYFTPASNMKLFTFYAGLKLLPDSLPALKYLIRHDSLIFWGTGDPTLLHSRLKTDRAILFLKQSGKKLFFAPGRYQGPIYGRGWQIEDYNDYYQAERTELPLMDNLVGVKVRNGNLEVIPPAFGDCFFTDSLMPVKPFNIKRMLDQNRFNRPVSPLPDNFSQEVPYKTSLELTIKLLSDTLKRPVGIIQLDLPEHALTVYNASRDSAFREMLWPSDNFIAEQLLMQASGQLGKDLSPEHAIEYILKNDLSVLPDRPVWVDGSGLSRLNLVTPRDMVLLLTLIDQTMHNRQKLFHLLPAGGRTGTLKNAYPKTGEPFVFAKTGTLSNNYSQSGFLVTRKGKTYLFSFMNNNFVAPVTLVRQEMARILAGIHDKF